MRVKVSAPSRLHLGFLDLSNQYYNRFGGLGVSIQKPRYKLEFKESNEIKVIGKQKQRIKELINELKDLIEFSGLFVDVEEVIPRHKGFGSGTALTLSILEGINELYGLDLDLVDVALELGRGKYSGVGLNTYRDGCFIVEGGKNDKVILQLFKSDFPENWRFIICVPEGRGKSGEEEKNAFEELLPVGKGYSEEVCALTFMSLVPSLVNKDIEAFGSNLNKIQEKMGRVFCDLQGGAFSSEIGEELVSFLDRFCFGVGQSSWGPTIYGLTTKEKAPKIKEKVKKEFGDLSVFVTEADNFGVRKEVIRE